MSDMEVLFTAWFFVMSAGLLFVSVLYWVIRGLVAWKDRKRRRMALIGDPFCFRRDR